MEHPKTVKVKDPSGVNEFIIINEADLTDDFELLEKPVVKLGIAQIRKELTDRNIDFDPEASRADLLTLLNAAPAQ